MLKTQADFSDLSPQDKAHHAESRVKYHLVEGRKNFLQVGAWLYVVKEHRLWENGYKSFAQFAAQEGINLKSTQAYDLVNIWEIFVLQHNQNESMLSKIDKSRLVSLIPYARKDDFDALDWAGKAMTLSTADWIDELDGTLRGKQVYSYADRLKERVLSDMKEILAYDGMEAKWYHAAMQFKEAVDG